MLATHRPKEKDRLKKSRVYKLKATEKKWYHCLGKGRRLELNNLDGIKAE